MVARSTSSSFQPPPPGKVLAAVGTFRNSAAVSRANFSEGARASGTATLASVVVGNTITIGGIALTAATSQSAGALNFSIGTLATASITAAGIRPGDTITLDGTVLTAAGAQVGGAYNFNEGTRASGTATVAVTPSTATLTIGGIALTPAGGPRTPGNDDYDETLGTTDAIAADINAAINDPANSFLATVLSTVLASDVTIRAQTPGTVGNAITLASSDGTITVSGATLAGGVGDNTTVAASIAAAINDALNVPIPTKMTAIAAAAAVNLTSDIPGAAGNALTLATSAPARAVLSGATFAGGSGSDIATATNLVTAIRQNTTSNIAIADNAGGSSAIVTIQASAPGTAGNSITLASAGGTIAVSGATLTGGTPPVRLAVAQGTLGVNAGGPPVGANNQFTVSGAITG